MELGVTYEQDPYAGKETRPDAGEALTSRGQAFQRFDLWGCSVHGDTIGQELRQSGRAELIGKTIGSSEDLVALTPVYG